MVSALPEPIAKIFFTCIIATSIFIAFISIILGQFKVLATVVGVTLGILFLTVAPIVFSIAIFNKLRRDLQGGTK